MIDQGVYRHHKGSTYTMLMEARCSDNGPNEGRRVVVYVSHTTGEVCTRFKDEFQESVKSDSQIPTRRFNYHGDSLKSPEEVSEP